MSSPAGRAGAGLLLLALLLDNPANPAGPTSSRCSRCTLRAVLLVIIAQWILKILIKFSIFSSAFCNTNAYSASEGEKALITPIKRSGLIEFANITLILTMLYN